MINFDLNKNLSVELTDNNGKPVAKIILSVTLFADTKNNYSVFLPPTNSEGKTNVSLMYLKDSVENDRKLFLMDYATPFEDLAENCQLSLLSEDAIQRALDAYELFKDSTEYPENYQNELLEANNKNYNSFDMMTSISKLIKGEKVAIFQVRK